MERIAAGRSPRRGVNWRWWHWTTALDEAQRRGDPQIPPQRATCQCVCILAHLVAARLSEDVKLDVVKVRENFGYALGGGW